MRRLLIRPGAIGDCILSFPALEFLRSDYTEVWLSTAVVPLVKFADRVCPISSTGLDLVGLQGVDVPGQLRERLATFDEVVSWYGTNRPEFRSAFSRFCSHAVFHQALPPVDSNCHATHFFCSQVGAPTDLVPRLCVGPIQPRGTVVIHPFSGSARKNWPLDSFRELGSRLEEKIEWIAGPEEGMEGANRFGNLLDLAAWMSGASLYIGNDSGITHLAAATGIRTLALFGPTSPHIWAPRGPHITVLQRNPISGLGVDEVLAAVNRLLGSR